MKNPHYAHTHLWQNQFMTIVINYIWVLCSAKYYKLSVITTNCRRFTNICEFVISSKLKLCKLTINSNISHSEIYNKIFNVQLMAQKCCFLSVQVSWCKIKCYACKNCFLHTGTHILCKGFLIIQCCILTRNGFNFNKE